MKDSENSKHPFSKCKYQDIVKYTSLIATSANIDNSVIDKKILNLREFCKNVGIKGKDFGLVISAAEDPKSFDAAKTVLKLKESDLRFTVVTEMFYLNFDNGIISDKEKKQIYDIAKSIGVKDEQVLAIEKYVRVASKAKNSKSSKEEFKKLGGQLLSSLASVGVPVGTVAASGSVVGLSAAGITSGLAALGMGAGMATGVGVAVAIGVGSYFGVNWAYNKIVGE